MFRKYEKTFRILVPEINVRGKFYLSDEEHKRLLGGRVFVTEKLDGANIGIIRTRDGFRFQKRGSLVDIGEHPQYGFLKAWGNQNYEKLMKIQEGWIVYGELLKYVHTVEYDALPDWVCVFNIWDRKHYMPFDEVQSMCEEWGIQTVPLLFEGYTTRSELFQMLPNPSRYGSEKAEGIVVTNPRQQLRGKLVREEFVKHLEDHEHWRYQQLTENRLRAPE